MDASKSPPSPEIFCPECRAILAPELRERLLHGESVFCEMCGTKYPQISVEQFQNLKVDKKVTDKQIRRNAFQEEFRKQKEYLRGWANVFKDEWQKHKKDQQEKLQKQKDRMRSKWQEGKRRFQARWQEQKRRIQSRWAKWKARWKARQEAKQLNQIPQHSLSPMQNILLSPANFDPLTGNRIVQQPVVSERPVFRFNPLTGKPLAGSNTLTFKFDPLTGKPLQQTLLQPETSSKSPENSIAAENIPTQQPNPVPPIIPDERKMAFDPITGEPIIEGFVKDRIFTVLEPRIRERLLKLQVSEEDREVIAQAMVFLTVEQQNKYLTELEQVNSPDSPNEQAIIFALRALPIPESDKQSLINQLSFIPEEKHPEFVAQIVNSHTKQNDSDKKNAKPVNTNPSNNDLQIPSNDFKDQPEKPKEKKKLRERELA